MKSTSLVCGALAASLGFGTVAEAQPQHSEREHAQQWRGRAGGGQRHSAPQYNRRWQAYDHDAPRAYAPRSYAYGGYYGAPHYRPYYGPSYSVGSYAPVFAARRYWINDWQARRLYAPPYGYEWVQTDTGDVLLIALATGLIANAILAAH